LGDLDSSKDISDIAARFGRFDLAAIGFSACQPIWHRNSHVSLAEVVQIHRELKIKQSIGMPWGTFPMGQEHAWISRRKIRQWRARRRV
jgi:N-acyl-phosphatidylethanolamine-hydrolysing phospholipase D